MDNLLEIKNLNLFFKGDKQEYQALYDLNLSFEKGKVHAIVGESGCGKTMTVMSVLGLIPKTAYIKSGEILFSGENVLEYKASEMRNLRGNRISLIPQDPMTSLNPLYTIENQLVEAVQAHIKVNKRHALRKVKEVLALVKIPNIENILKSYPHELSGGMKQRVLIAMALLGNSELIIADEPTTALDVTIQKQIMDLILEIQRELNVTVILISHDLALISNYADTVTVMYAGHVVEKADAKEFLSNVKHPYSMALLNSLPSANTGAVLKVISGIPPSLNEKIDGCKFHPRCQYAEAGLCDIESPKLEEKCKSHWCACYKVSGCL
ncbi:MAG: ABC transporter ATP-binding protein [bacterium]|nr:ABC transporter ATP-binding protein [bacterium]